MSTPQFAVGATFPSVIPSGTKPGSHYLHFTRTLFNISYYTKTPKHHAAQVNQGRFKVYFAAIGSIALIKIDTPIGRLYFAPNLMVLSDEEFDDWISIRRFAVTGITFYLLNMTNTVKANRDITIIGQQLIYDVAERQREIFKTPQQVEEETDYLFKTYSPRALERQFILIG